MSVLLSQLLSRPVKIRNRAISTNYNNIKIIGSTEPLVKITEESGIKLMPRDKFGHSENRTVDYWVRESVLAHLIIANNLIKDVSNGKFCLYIRDAYRPIEMQREDWDKIMQEVGGKVDVAKMLVSDPRGFNEKDPKTWPTNTPSHATGASVDVYLWSENLPESYILINKYPEMYAHYKTDFFEKKVLKTVLSPIEETCLLRRRLLVNAMEMAGFKNYASETWHFDFMNQSWAQSMMFESPGSSFTAKYGFIANPEKNML